MNLKLTDEELAFRDELRTFFTTEFPAEIREKVVAGRHLERDEVVRSQQILNAKGLAVPNWPVEWGGKDWTPVQRHIWLDEMQLASVPDPLPFNASMIGPVIAHFGSQELRERFLPATANLDIWWCQGFSEPEAGSDLASLKTRAVRDGDDYIVNGQKIWTTGAHHGDWCFLLARTDPSAPKHKGISFLLVDMKTPGITVRPIVNMAGFHEFNEVFFEDVRVPAANRVGEENNGWYVAMTLLDFERSNVASIAANQRSLEMLAEYVKERHPGGAYRDILRHRLADLWTANEVGRLLSYRTAWMQEAGKIANYEASVIKVLATELGMKIMDFGVNLLGPAGGLEPGSKHVRWDGVIEKGFLSAVSPTIYSGSSEIQRNIIATRGLGLPRD